MKFLFTFFILISNPATAQINETDLEGRKQGAWEKYWDATQSTLQYKGQFINDFPVGDFWYYYPSGEVRAVIEHLNKRSSFVTFYFKNKQVMSEGMYLNQKRDSIWINYNRQGYRVSMEKYRDGKLNGKKAMFYIQNQIDWGELKVLSETMYSDSLKSGPFLEYFSSGIVKKRGAFENDKEAGIWTTFDINGIPIQFCQYKKGLKHGWVYRYKSVSEVIATSLYRRGELLNGKMKSAYLKECELKGIDPND
jgi:antitoxin component YwqK of YwqJK toxin-antitoxin module